MTDDDILKGLKLLGVDRDSFRALALLPLVQVAWADGRIQGPERRLILKTAKENGYLEGSGANLLEGWLKKRPASEYFDRARTLLIAIVHRDSGIGSSLGIEALTDPVDLCDTLARSAGGLFGIFGMDEREKSAIREICDTIGLPPESSIDFEQWKVLDS